MTASAILITSMITIAFLMRVAVNSATYGTIVIDVADKGIPPLPYQATERDPGAVGAPENPPAYEDVPGARLSNPPQYTINVTNT